MSRIFSLSLILVAFTVSSCYQTAGKVAKPFKYQKFVSVSPNTKLSGTICGYRSTVMQEPGSLEINGGPAIPSCTSLVTFDLPQRTHHARTTIMIRVDQSKFSDWWWKDRGEITLKIQSVSFTGFGTRGNWYSYNSRAYEAVKVRRLKKSKLVEVGKGQKVVVADVSQMIPREATRLQVAIGYKAGLSKITLKKVSLRFHN